MPFSAGTLAVNSVEVDAFTPEHIDILQALQDRTAAAEMIGQVRKSVWAMTAAADIEQVLETVGEGLRRMRVPYDFASVSILSEESDGEVYTINQLGEWRARNEPVETTTISEIVKGGVVRYRPDIRADDPFGEALL